MTAGTKFDLEKWVNESASTIMDAVMSGELSVPDGKAACAERERRIKAQAGSGVAEIEFLPAVSGGISVYERGRRFPITAYPAQWLRLLAGEDHVRFIAFVRSHLDVEANKRLAAPLDAERKRKAALREAQSKKRD